MYLYNYFVKFQDTNSNFLQFENKDQIGVIKWENGCEYNGIIYKNAPIQGNEFIDQNGVKYTVSNNVKDEIN